MLRHVTYSTQGYLVPRADGRLLVGATVEDVGFENAVTQEGLESLVMAGLEILPGLSPLPIAEHWSGLRPFAADGLPVLGRIPGYDRAYLATAHFRNGILLAPKTAELIADGVIDNANSTFFEIYGADRFAEKTTATVPL
jgi:glycine/D-amino acid oxidase-like deaminating enzyme